MRLFLSTGHEVHFTTCSKLQGMSFGKYVFTACSKLQGMSFGKYVYSSLLLGFSYARRACLLK